MTAAAAISDGFLLLSAALCAADGCAASDSGNATTDTEAWRDDDLTRAAALLHHAYPPDVARHFAPRGTRAEWTRYVAALVLQSPCGSLDRVATRVVRSGSDLRALALVTFMPPATAHLAQLAVAPDSRRQRLATRLIEEAMALSAAAGRTELTLLVARSNDAARRLYESLGFRPSPDA